MNDEKKSGVRIQGLGVRGALSLLVGLFLFGIWGTGVIRFPSSPEISINTGAEAKVDGAKQRRVVFSKSTGCAGQKSRCFP